MEARLATSLWLRMVAPADWVDVEADFLPIAALEGGGQWGAVVAVAGADVQDGFGVHGLVPFFGFGAAVEVDQGVFKLAGKTGDVHQR